MPPYNRNRYKDIDEGYESDRPRGKFYPLLCSKFFYLSGKLNVFVFIN